MFEIHPQLTKDCHSLGRLASGHLLLHRNAEVTWFILVPETEAVDLLDLPPGELQRVMDDCQMLSAYLKQELNFPKVNFGAMGNVVPQLHLHIIGRTPDDVCWPRPVWGNLPEGKTHSAEAIHTFKNTAKRIADGESC